ncbi:hypothetical protein BST81_25500 [Leptolyngbya sp. 'hensonii']|uniref:hypothetical protein n=1 Tax=Leptolyngbya sp. 'hensonii' TaxID=1922337 RepID=UPI00094FAB6A|nr:hypothetical protein [Leptolyngbya sp. 'hensonii']OLP15568.1 hypothetical protein BST81_25500 [Leptolyngbya sp. 'hensonii']
MDAAQDIFHTNYLYKKLAYTRWHRQQSEQYILRSQLGFPIEVAPSRPRVCVGCEHYHGVSYGYSRARRSLLVCGFHPTGWTLDEICPDWQEMPTR